MKFPCDKNLHVSRSDPSLVELDVTDNPNPSGEVSRGAHKPHRMLVSCQIEPGETAEALISAVCHFRSG